MRVSTRLYAAAGLLLVGLVFLLAFHVQTIRQGVATSYELSQLSSRLFQGSTPQLVRLNELEDNASKFWVTGHPGYRERFDEVAEEFERTLAALAAEDLSGPERVEMERLEREWSRVRPVADRLVAERGTGPVLPAADAQLVDLQEALARVRHASRRMSGASQAIMAAQLSQLARAAERAERVSWAAAALAVLVGGLLAVFTVRWVTRSLGRLRRGTRAVADGDFDHRIPVTGQGEFADLARDFNEMTGQLGELERMKRDFLSKVSHDLKTPLASMQEINRVLLDEVGGPLTGRQRRFVSLSHESGKRLSGMIADILDLSSMEAGAFRLDTADHDVERLVRAAVDQVTPIAAEKAVALDADLPAGPIALRCDGDRTVQVLTNLVENAVKFSPPASTVRLSVRAGPEQEGGGKRTPEGEWVGSGVLFSVHDAGPGVPATERKRIFERFYQTEVGRRAPARGVGLGLAICREIVELHGGRIWMTDNAEGGSTCHVLLPHAARASEPVSAAHAGALSG